MRVLAAIALVGCPQFAFAQDDLVKWNDWGSYQVVGILSSDSLLIIQESVYFVCDLESESESYSVRNCLPAVTDSQIVSMQADAERARSEAIQKAVAQEAAVAAKAVADAAKLEAAAAAKLALGTLGKVSDDEFLEAFVSVLRANSCVFQLEATNIRNPEDLKNIMVALEIEGPISPLAETELKARSLSVIGKLLRDDKLEIGEFSKTIKLRDCN